MIFLLRILTLALSVTFLGMSGVALYWYLKARRGLLPHVTDMIAFASLFVLSAMVGVVCRLAVDAPILWYESPLFAIALFFGNRGLIRLLRSRP